MFARPWEGDAIVRRPWWLRPLPGPTEFRFRSEIENVAADSWDVVDTTTFPGGTVQRRRMHARLVSPSCVELSAGDMPGGARVSARSDGFDFTPYVIRTPVFGRVRVPLRHRDTVRLLAEDELLDEIELRLLGIRVGRVSMRLRPAP